MAHFKKRRAVVVTQFANGKLFGSCSLISWPNGYLVGCLFGYCISLKRSVGTNTTSHLIGTCHLKLDLKMRLYQPPQPLIHLTPPGPTPMPLTLMALKLFSNVLNRSIGQNVQLHHLNNCAMGHSCVSHKFYSVQNFISPMKVFMYLPTFDQGLML